MDDNQNQPPSDQNTPPAPPSPNQGVGSDADTDWEAEAKKWKHFARTHEANWEKASKELEKLNEANMTDAERTVAEAKELGRREALESVAKQRAQDKLETAAAKAGVDLTPVLEALDVSKFVAEGDVNAQAINNFVAQVASQFAPPKGPKFAQGLGIGPQGSSAAGQLTRADLPSMSPREIAQARKDGRLDAVLRGEN
ncbi:hypothetical protein SAMN05216275_10580 [Streptosporangium canum]|uniref:Uncharacterized protein n=1 Tax=Streptosporangium canum TaxID=324952 RepID=A0A1I3LB99_9ACTN|nr:hypothetical protein [Streptosporangium canum]SFI82017.1 hypothetical protein SAMN05216275_10580 [Streptosporangium canum]